MDRPSMSVRALAATAASCAFLCLGAASAAAAPLAVVANRGSEDVSLVDTGTNEVIVKSIEAGKQPGAVAITPDGHYAYVADRSGGTVAVIDLLTRQRVGKPIEVGKEPYGLAITPDGRHVFVTDSGGREVSVIDTQTRQVVGHIPIPGTSTPVGIAVAPDGKLAYVTDRTQNEVDVIDVDSMEVVGKPIEVGKNPSGVELTPDGRTAYVVDETGEVSAIDTATRDVLPIPLKRSFSRWITVGPDGTRAYVVNTFTSSSITIIDTRTNEEVGEFSPAAEPQEVAVSANGKVLYVLEVGPAQIERLDAKTGARIGSPIPLPGNTPTGIAIAPDQSPTAAFTPPAATVGVPALFSGAASTDPDGTIASYTWAFGDGGTASGVSPTHTYAAPGTYSAKLSVVDNEGCGTEEVFTGRTAYCSGAAPAVHPVTAKVPEEAPILAPSPPPPSNEFTIRRIVHNRRNGTVRLQVRLPSAGFVLLFGPKVHAVTRKSKGVQTMWLTIHARVELAKRLKKILRAPVRFRITFTPNGGTAKTVHRGVTLQRTPRHRHGR